MSSTTGDEFYARVAAAAEGTPYQVTRSKDGFDVTLALADSTWYGAFNVAGLQKVFIHHVAVGDGTYTITDDSREVRWVAGHPQVSANATRELGRSIEFGREKVWAMRTDGTIGPVVDYSFNSLEGRELIDVVGEQMGLTAGRGTSEKIGLYVGLGTIGLIVLAGIVVLILWLAGVIPPE